MAMKHIHSLQRGIPHHYVKTVRPLLCLRPTDQKEVSLNSVQDLESPQNVCLLFSLGCVSADGVRMRHCQTLRISKLGLRMVSTLSGLGSLGQNPVSTTYKLYKLEQVTWSPNFSPFARWHQHHLLRLQRANMERLCWHDPGSTGRSSSMRTTLTASRQEKKKKRG